MYVIRCRNEGRALFRTAFFLKRHLKSRKVFKRNCGGANDEGLIPKNVSFVIFLQLFAAQKVQTDSHRVVLVYYILLTIAIH